MNPEDHPGYEAWVASQGESDPPAGFEARVMEAVHARAAGPRDLWARPWFRTLAWAAASLVFALRFAASALVLWVG